MRKDDRLDFFFGDDDRNIVTIGPATRATTPAGELDSLQTRKINGVPAICLGSGTATGADAFVEWIRGPWSLYIHIEVDQQPRGRELVEATEKRVVEMAEALDNAVAGAIRTASADATPATPAETEPPPGDTGPPKTSVVVLVDRSGCVANQAELQRVAGAVTRLGQLLGRQAGGRVECSLLSFDGAATHVEQPFTTDPEVLGTKAAAMTLKAPVAAGAEADDLSWAVARAVWYAQLNAAGSSPMVHVVSCGNRISPARLARLNQRLRGMFGQRSAPGSLWSLAWALMAAPEPVGPAALSFEELLAEIERLAQQKGRRVTVNVVGYRVAPGSGEESSLRSIAESSGGRYVPALGADDVGPALTQLAEAAPETSPQPPAVAGPGVGRTLVYHQITSVSKEDAIHVYNGQESRLSASGNRVAFSMREAPGDAQRRSRIAVVEPDGSNLRVIDTIAAAPQVDISADGRTVAAAGGGELRVASADGGGRLLQAISNTGDVRITADGRRIVYCQASNGLLAETGQAKVYERGIWTISADGSGWRKLIGATEVAQALGIRPDEVKNFYSDSRGSALDISADGSRLVFLVNAPSGDARSHLFAANGDGSGARRIASTDGHVANVGISDDGSTIAWCAVAKNGATKSGWVAGFDGSGQRKLTDRADMGRSLSLSADGRWVVFGAEAVLYRTDGSDLLVLGPYGNVLSDKRFGWDRMTNLVMGADARRFLFVIGDTQLALLDLDPADLGASPQISEVSLTPPEVQPDPRRLMTVKARVTTPYPIVTQAVQVHLFLNGRLDETIGGGEDLRDDAKGYGDETYGDGIYTSTNVHGETTSPPGPRRVRIKAEIAAPDGRHHATVVEVAAGA
jgi:Tol biopolymer transport system component/nucleotide-binding universal stress UspA family protein